MANKQKIKGNNGELRIAKFLSELYEQKFIRVPNSGAYTGGSNVSRKEGMDAGQIATFKADLIPPTNMQKLVIESKFYKSFPFEKLIKNDPIPLLDGWIEQAKTSADKDDFWVVVIRINNKGSFVLFDRKFLYLFKLRNYCNYYGYVITEFETFFTDNKDPIAYLVRT